MAEFVVRTAGKEETVEKCVFVTGLANMFGPRLGNEGQRHFRQGIGRTKINGQLSGEKAWVEGNEWEAESPAET